MSSSSSGSELRARRGALVRTVVHALRWSAVLLASACRNPAPAPSESPPSDLIAAVRSGDVDIAIAWGPLAGYYATRFEPELAIMPVPEGPGGPETFRYDIAMAVRHDDEKLRDELDRALVAERARIDAVLRAFAVPRL